MEPNDFQDPLDNPFPLDPKLNTTYDFLENEISYVPNQGRTQQDDRPPIVQRYQLGVFNSTTARTTNPNSATAESTSSCRDEMLNAQTTNPSIQFKIEENANTPVVFATSIFTSNVTDYPNHMNLDSFNIPATYGEGFANRSLLLADAVGSYSNIGYTQRVQEADDFDLEFGSTAEAHQYIIDLPTMDCTRFEVHDDDWAEIKGLKFLPLCVNLFAALWNPPSGCPEHFTEKQKEYFLRNHQVIYQKVCQELDTGEKQKIAKARVIIMMQRIVQVHEIGVPDDHDGKTTDKRLTCGQRALKVIDYVRTNKYVAQDILSGTNFETLARCPDGYVKKKLANIKSNTDRGSVSKTDKGTKKRKITTDVQETASMPVDSTLDEFKQQVCPPFLDPAAAMYENGRTYQQHLVKEEQADQEYWDSQVRRR